MKVDSETVNRKNVLTKKKEKNIYWNDGYLLFSRIGNSKQDCFFYKAKVSRKTAMKIRPGALVYQQPRNVKSREKGNWKKKIKYEKF